MSNSLLYGIDPNEFSDLNSCIRIRTLLLVCLLYNCIISWASALSTWGGVSIIIVMVVSPFLHSIPALALDRLIVYPLRKMCKRVYESDNDINTPRWKGHIKEISVLSHAFINKICSPLSTSISTITNKHLTLMVALRYDLSEKGDIDFQTYAFSAVENWSGIIQLLTPYRLVAIFGLNGANHQVNACQAALSLREQCQASGVSVVSSVVFGELKVGYGNNNYDSQLPSVDGPLWDYAFHLANLNFTLQTQTLITDDVRSSLSQENCCLVDYVHFSSLNYDMTPGVPVFELLSRPREGWESKFESSFNAFMSNDNEKARQLLYDRSQVLIKNCHFSRLLTLIKMREMGHPAVAHPYCRWFVGWQPMETLDCFDSTAPTGYGIMLPGRGAEAEERLVQQMSSSFATSAMAHDFSSLKGTTSHLDVLEVPLPRTKLSNTRQSTFNTNSFSKTDSSFEETNTDILHERNKPVVSVFTDSENHVWQVSSRQLGTGSYGQVHLGMDDTGRLVAVKQLKQTNCENIDLMLKEIRILAELHHKNIVSYLGSAFVANHFIIVMEYVAGGTLFHLIVEFGKLSASCVACYSLDILRGLAFLHCNEIVHRDVKPHNVLVQRSGVCKLADFGTAGKLEDKGVMGTVAYMAPEAIRGEWSPACDVWSVGVTIFQMLSGSLPFTGLSTTATPAMHIFKLQATMFALRDLSDLPDGGAHLIQSCLTIDVSMRPSAKEMQCYQFFNNHRESVQKRMMVAVMKNNFKSPTSPRTPLSATLWMRPSVGLPRPDNLSNLNVEILKF